LCKGGLDLGGENPEKGQLYQTFGCKATQGVKLDSTIAQNYYDSVLSKVKNGSCNILSAMKAFKKLEAQAEHVDNTTVDTLTVRFGPVPEVKKEVVAVEKKVVVTEKKVIASEGP